MSTLGDLHGNQEDSTLEGGEKNFVKAWQYGTIAGGAVFIGVAGACAINWASKKHNEKLTEKANDEIRRDLMDQLSPRK